MILICVIAGILLILLLLLLLSVKIDIRADGEMYLTLRILFLRFRLLPKKEKPIDLSDYKIKRFRKRKAKEEEKQRRKEAKKEKKQERAQKKKDRKKKTPEEKPKPAVKDYIRYGSEILRYVVADAVASFGKYLRIDIRGIHILLAGSEPDKLAITYGAVLPTVGFIKEILDDHLHTKYHVRNGSPVTVDIDFIGEKSVFRVDLTLSIRVWQILVIGISAFKNYLTRVESL